MYNYRIYLYREFGYELEKITTNALEIDNYITRKDKDYSRLLVIRHDIPRNMDIPFALKYFDSYTYKETPKKRVKKKENEK